MTNPQQLVQKLWNYCSILRDDGLGYGDYVEQLTYLLFLKSGSGVPPLGVGDGKAKRRVGHFHFVACKLLFSCYVTTACRCWERTCTLPAPARVLSEIGMMI